MWYNLNKRRSYQQDGAHDIMKKGIFITVEGTDGSGKTTQIKRLEKYLTERGREVILVREPGGTDISERIRPIILNPASTEMGNITEMLLYAAARAQLVKEVIKPALDKNKIVICDRFIDSTYAYQGYGRGIDMGILEMVNNVAINGVIPDMTLFFDISPEVALKRRMASSEADRIENESTLFHRRVYEGYLELAARFADRIKRIDASVSVEKVWEEVKTLVDAIMD